VDCHECAACCSSSQFIHIRPKETRTLERLPKEILAAAPGLPPGNMLIGYDRQGACPMLTGGKCSIYKDRPLTCRNYDCRVFAAAGLAPVGDAKALITERVKRWTFSYPAARDREEHLAVQAAAEFIQEKASHFPGGRIPADPGQLAILAIKVYDVFLKEADPSATMPSADAELAAAVVAASRNFDARRKSCQKE